MVKDWTGLRLPKDGETFPAEGDVMDCNECRQRMKYTVLGGEEGAGFVCHDCDNQVWCYLDESGESYWDNYEYQSGKKKEKVRS